MKELTAAIALAGSMLCSSALAAVIDRSAPVAVMDFGTRPGATVAEININNAEHTTSEYIITRLVNRNCFDVMDKDLVLDKLAAEKLKTTGIIDPDTAKRIGALLHTRYIVYGNVTNVSTSKTGTEFLGSVGGSINVATVKAHIIARVMDIDTGNIIMIGKGEGHSKSSFTKIKAGQNFMNINVIKIGAVKVSQESVHNAIRKAAYAAVDDLILKLYSEDNKKWKIK